MAAGVPAYGVDPGAGATGGGGATTGAATAFATMLVSLVTDPGALFR